MGIDVQPRQYINLIGTRFCNQMEKESLSSRSRDRDLLIKQIQGWYFNFFKRETTRSDVGNLEQLEQEASQFLKKYSNLSSSSGNTKRYKFNGVVIPQKQFDNTQRLLTIIFNKSQLYSSFWGCDFDQAFELDGRDKFAQFFTKFKTIVLIKIPKTVSAILANQIFRVCLGCIIFFKTCEWLYYFIDQISLYFASNIFPFLINNLPIEIFKLFNFLAIFMQKMILPTVLFCCLGSVLKYKLPQKHWLSPVFNKINMEVYLQIVDSLESTFRFVISNAFDVVLFSRDVSDVIGNALHVRLLNLEDKELEKSQKKARLVWQKIVNQQLIYWQEQPLEKCSLSTDAIAV